MLPAMFGSSVAQVSILARYADRVVSRRGQHQLAVLLRTAHRVSARRVRRRARNRDPAAARRSSTRRRRRRRFSATLDWALRLVLVIACPAAIALDRARRAGARDAVPRRRVRRSRRVDGGRERARVRAGPRRVHPRQGARARLFCEAGYAHAGADRGAGFVARNGAESDIRVDAPRHARGARARRNRRRDRMRRFVQRRVSAARLVESGHLSAERGLARARSRRGGRECADGRRADLRAVFASATGSRSASSRSSGDSRCSSRAARRSTRRSAGCSDCARATCARA